MERKYLRDYDLQIVTNKFAVGECIEWMNSIWEDPYEHILFIQCFTGIIKKITPYTVLIIRSSSDEQIEEIRMDKCQLAQDVTDWESGKTIKASIGQQDPSKKSSKDGNIPHDAYRLRDPRDGTIFYIGISKNVQRRYQQHLACSGLNFKLNLRIQEILQCGLIPELEIIEAAMTGSAKARDREKFWIEYHTHLGYTLTNIAEMDEAK